jgi:hypothetical protein
MRSQNPGSIHQSKAFAPESLLCRNDLAPRETMQTASRFEKVFGALLQQNRPPITKHSIIQAELQFHFPVRGAGEYEVYQAICTECVKNTKHATEGPHPLPSQVGGDQVASDRILEGRAYRGPRQQLIENGRDLVHLRGLVDGFDKHVLHRTRSE